MSFRKTLNKLLIAGTLATSACSPYAQQPEIYIPTNKGGVRAEQVENTPYEIKKIEGEDIYFTLSPNGSIVSMDPRGFRDRNVDGQPQKVSTFNYALGLVKEGEKPLKEITLKGTVEDFINSYRIELFGRELYVVKVRESELNQQGENQQGKTNHYFIDSANAYDKGDGTMTITGNFYRGFLLDDNNIVAIVPQETGKPKAGKLEIKCGGHFPCPEEPAPTPKFVTPQTQVPATPRAQPTLPVQPQVPVQPEHTPSQVMPYQPQEENIQRDAPPPRIEEEPTDVQGYIWYDGNDGRDNDGDGSPIDLAGKYKQFHKSPFQVSLGDDAIYWKNIGRQGNGAKWIGESSGEYFFYFGGRWYRFDKQKSFRFSS
ncbi:MAG: hypothetical protein AABX28_02500 [Nanoarchaeota archaeon]